MLFGVKGKNTVQVKIWLDKCYGMSSSPKSFIGILNFHVVVLLPKWSNKSALFYWMVEKCLWYLRSYTFRFSMKICIWESSVQYGYRIFSISTKEDNESMILGCFALYNCNPCTFLRRYIMVDEIWIQWTSGQSVCRVSKTEQKASKAC